jgi:hypothetical protein
MIEYHPTLTTLMAYALGILTGLLVVLIVRVQWASLFARMFKKLWEVGNLRLVIELRRKDEKKV